MLALPALLGVKLVKPAYAEDVQSAKGAAAERKAEFKETAQKIKQTGKNSYAWSHRCRAPHFLYFMSLMASIELSFCRLGWMQFHVSYDFSCG